MKTQAKIETVFFLILFFGMGMTRCSSETQTEILASQEPASVDAIHYKVLHSPADSAAQLYNSFQGILRTDVSFAMKDPLSGTGADTSGLLEITFLESLVEVIVGDHEVLNEQIDSLRYTWLVLDFETQLNVGQFFPIFPFYPDTLQPATGTVMLPGAEGSGDTIEMSAKYYPRMQNHDQVVTGGLAVIVITIDPAEPLSLKVLKVEYHANDGTGWHEIACVGSVCV